MAKKSKDLFLEFDLGEFSWDFAIHLAEKHGDSAYLQELLNGKGDIPRSARKWFADMFAGKLRSAKRRGPKARINYLDAIKIRSIFRNLRHTSQFYKRNPREVENIAREFRMNTQTVRSSLKALGLGMSSEAIVEFLAKQFNSSTGTIRDVIAKRGIYADK